jgi:diguanylate cyclase (GGDEF)-like protein
MSGVDNSLIAAHVRHRWLWRISGAAVIAAVSAGVFAYHLYADSEMSRYQLYISHLATRLTHNVDHARAMGAIIMVGRDATPVFDLVNSHGVSEHSRVGTLFARMISEFDLDEVFVLDRQGAMIYRVAKPSGATDRPLVQDLARRPYFVRAIRGYPTSYIAVGRSAGQRGIYFSAPIFPDDVGTPEGVIVAKAGFRVIDGVLADESLPLAVFSPEGVVLASNQPDWMFRVDSRRDLGAARRSDRLSTAFAHREPQPLFISPDGYLQDHLRQGQMVSAELDWSDPTGRWLLCGFVRTFDLAGFGISLFASVMTFLTLFLLGAWVQANIALELYASVLEKKNLRLSDLTHTDALTGIGNRRLFDKALQEEWSRARRSGQYLSLLMIDVDLFKKYNDHYGHQAGDECLRAVAGAIGAQARRPSDRACRYGGEEFTLILSDTTGTSGRVLAEAVRAAVASLNLVHAVSPHGVVTVSIGLASVEPGEDSSPQHLLEAADKALYRAKFNGRNRVEEASADR